MTREDEDQWAMRAHREDLEAFDRELGKAPPPKNGDRDAAGMEFRDGWWQAPVPPSAWPLVKHPEQDDTDTEEDG